jgi:hypothetical protein
MLGLHPNLYVGIVLYPQIALSLVLDHVMLHRREEGLVLDLVRYVQLVDRLYNLGQLVAKREMLLLVFGLFFWSRLELHTTVKVLCGWHVVHF